MALGTNDIRYRARCQVIVVRNGSMTKCNAPLGDWALRAPPEKQRCFNHRAATFLYETSRWKK